MKIWIKDLSLNEMLDEMYWFWLSRPASMYMVSSGLVGRGFRLQIPEALPETMAVTSEDACYRCRRNVKSL